MFTYNHTPPHWQDERKSLLSLSLCPPQKHKKIFLSELKTVTPLLLWATRIIITMTTTNLPFQITMKLILSSFASLVVITLFFISRTDFSPSSFQPSPDSTLQISNYSTGSKSPNQESVNCGKIPPSVADALIHYAASNVTPQQTLSEISVTKKVTNTNYVQF